MKNGYLRHTLATIDYRFKKCINNAGEDFVHFKPEMGVRTPVELICHMHEEMCFTRNVLSGENPEFVKYPVEGFEKEIYKFTEILVEIDNILSKKKIDTNFTNRLLQGPFSDVLTHIGQLAMLKRFSGDTPLPAEDFSSAKISFLTM